MTNAAFDWLKSLMQRRGPSHAERLAARQMVADTNLPGALLDKVGEGERAVLDFVGPNMPPAQELGMRASAVPFGAGRKQLEEYGQSDRGRAGLDNTREFFGREPIGKTFDWAMGNEPGTFGTAAMLGLAQEAPIGLASAPVSSGNAMMRAAAKPMAQQVAGRGMRAAALRMGKAGVREAPMGAGVGAGMGALQSEPGERMQGAMGGAAVGGAGAFLAGAGGQGAQELSRARVTRAFEDARRAANEAGIDVAAPGLTPERAAELEGRQWEAGGDFVNWWDKHGGGQPPMGGKEAIPDVADYFAANNVLPPPSPEEARYLLNSYRSVSGEAGTRSRLKAMEAAAARPEDVGWADLNEPPSASTGAASPKAAARKAKRAAR
jgi:hypothetical protein